MDIWEVFRKFLESLQRRMETTRLVGKRRERSKGRI